MRPSKKIQHAAACAGCVERMINQKSALEFDQNSGQVDQIDQIHGKYIDVNMVNVDVCCSSTLHFWQFDSHFNLRAKVKGFGKEPRPRTSSAPFWPLGRT